MDWSRLPRKFLTSWVDAPRCRGRAHSYGHNLTHELQQIGFNTDRAAVQLGVSLSWGAAAQDRDNGASSQLGYRWRLSLWKRNPSPNK
jgi:hypothetical protein